MIVHCMDQKTFRHTKSQKHKYDFPHPTVMHAVGLDLSCAHSGSSRGPCGHCCNDLWVLVKFNLANCPVFLATDGKKSDVAGRIQPWLCWERCFMNSSCLKLQWWFLSSLDLFFSAKSFWCTRRLYIDWLESYAVHWLMRFCRIVCLQKCDNFFPKNIIKRRMRCHS